MKNIPVEGNSNLERDYFSGAIVNKNINEYEKFIEAKKLRDIKEVKLDTALNEVSMLKLEMQEIKSLLLSIINKNG
jgi:hypothetical protein